MAARLIFSVLCQPPRKTLESVMLTSCITVTLYRHRKKRREGGEIETDGKGTVDNKKKKSKYIWHKQTTAARILPNTFPSFSLAFSTH